MHWNSLLFYFIFSLRNSKSAVWASIPVHLVVKQRESCFLLLPCSVRKMCSCQHLNAQLPAPEPSLRPGRLKPTFTVNWWSSQGKDRFESLSPTLLSVLPVSRFGLPVLSPSPSTQRVWQTNFLPWQEGISSLTGLTVHRCPAVQINSILSAQQFNLGHQVGTEATCRSVCHAADVEVAAEAQLEMQKHGGTALGWNTFSFYSL